MPAGVMMSIVAGKATLPTGAGECLAVGFVARPTSRKQARESHDYKGGTTHARSDPDGCGSTAICMMRVPAMLNAPCAVGTHRDLQWDRR